jgi:amino acid transporter
MTTDAYPVSSAVGQPGTARMRRGQIGVPGMVFMALAVTAPLTAMASNIPISIGLGAGLSTLGWLLVIGMLLAVYTSGYIALSRQVVSPGAYHAYVSYGLGTGFGAAVAYMASITYNLACAGMIAATGFFADLTLSVHAGLDLPWAAYSFAALVVVGLLGHFGVDVASKVTGAVCVLQCALLGALTIAVFIEYPTRIDVSGFNPTAVFNEGFALTAVFCLLCFAAYETAAIYGEECDAPRHRIQRATYVTLGALFLVFLLSTLTLIAAYDDVVTAAAANPGGLLDGAISAYLGSSAGALVGATVAFSFLAAAVSLHAMAARYMLAMGRSGLLPHQLASISRRRGTPAVATATQLTLNVLVLATVLFAGADPLLSLFPAIAGVNSLSLIVIMTLCSISALVAARRGRLPGGRLSTQIAPGVAVLGLLTCGVLIVANYEQVTGSSSDWVAAMPLILAVGAVVGIVAARRSTVSVATLDRSDELDQGR